MTHVRRSFAMVAFEASDNRMAARTIQRRQHDHYRMGARVPADRAPAVAVVASLAGRGVKP